MLRCCLLMIGVLAIAPAASAAQDDVPSDVSFAIRRATFGKLFDRGDGHSVGARYSMSLRMGEHSSVHDVGKDCELHVAGKPATSIGTPAGVVAEPPNVCKRRIPALGAGPIKAAWENYFTNSVKGKQCDVIGFPRIFSEHASGGTTGGSNPDHVFELHPALSIDCGANPVDFEPFLTYYAGMSSITQRSTSTCLADRRLFVRFRGSAGKEKYEFAEEGARGGEGGQCGNFMVVEANVNKEYLRELTNSRSGSNAKDHVALARVWVGDDGPYPLKIYTYAGTSADAQVAQLMADADQDAQSKLMVHGLVTYDYYTIRQVIQSVDGQGQHSWRDDLRDWTPVPNPLALIVFGECSLTASTRRNAPPVCTIRP